MASRTHFLPMLLAAVAGTQVLGLIEKEHVYSDGTGAQLVGYLIYQDISGDPTRPGLLVFPGPWGNGGGAHERAIARIYAEKGMVVFLADYQTGNHSEDSLTDLQAVMSVPFLADTVQAQSIALLGLQQLTSQSITDASKVGVVGFCFGGAMALNLARAGGSVEVAVSLHGEYPPHGDVTGDYNVKYFVEMTGKDDPLVPPAARDSWINELAGYTAGTNMGYDLKIWGDSLHSFSIRWSDTMYEFMATMMQSTVTADGGELNGVAGVVQYDPSRAAASFDRIDDLFKEYGLIKALPTGGDTQSCRSLKASYKGQNCCGMPDQELQGSATCQDLKDYYTDVGCCGMPDKMVMPGPFAYLPRS